MIWFYFYAAVQRGTLSIKWARKTTVDNLKRDTLAVDEAVGFLEMAHEGVFDTDDMPEQWHGIFDNMEREM